MYGNLDSMKKQIKKICNKCNLEKDYNSFGKNQRWCKECFCEYRSNNYGGTNGYSPCRNCGKKRKLNPYKECNKCTVLKQCLECGEILLPVAFYERRKVCIDCFNSSRRITS